MCSEQKGKQVAFRKKKQLVLLGKAPLKAETILGNFQLAESWFFLSVCFWLNSDSRTVTKVSARTTLTCLRFLQINDQGSKRCLCRNGDIVSFFLGTTKSKTTTTISRILEVVRLSPKLQLLLLGYSCVYIFIFYPDISQN